MPLAVHRYYVNPNTAIGMDDRALPDRADLPYNTAQAAITAFIPGALQMLCLTGTTPANPVKEYITYVGSDPVIVCSADGTQQFWSGSHTIGPASGWVNTTGNIWSLTLTGTYPTTGLTLTAIGYPETVGDLTFPDLALKWNSQDPAAPAASAPAAGCFGCVGGANPTAYVQMPAGENPNSYTFQLSRLATSINAAGTGRVDFLNIVMKYFSAAGMLCGSSVGGNPGTIMTARYCEASYSFTGYHSGGQFAVMKASDSAGYRNADDTVSPHSTGPMGSSVVIAERVRGGANGYYPSDSSQTLTNHDECILAVIGGEGHYDTGGQAMVGKSLTILADDPTTGPVKIIGAQRLGNTGSGVNAQAGLNAQDTATIVCLARTHAHAVEISNCGGPGVKVSQAVFPNATINGLTAAQLASSGLPSMISSGTGNGNALADSYT